MPHAIKVEGTKIVATDANAPLPLADGWINVTADQYGQALATDRPQWVEEQVTEGEAPPVALVPDTIANWRAKAVLALAGLLPAVEAALNDLPEPAHTVAMAAWNGNADFVRDGPTVLALADTLSLTPAQIDDLFIQAAALEV